MPTVIIDNRSIEVAEGTKIISAAERLGIMIPRFCFHPALGAVGACRVCAVKFLEGPVKGIQMSCMIDAKDGMVVSTDDPEAMEFRRQVIEWLMISHPHDCPVCDEGGHCLLQDMTVSGGHGRRRYPGPKRTHVDQYLGPLVQHEMNRCIQCYRCSRFYQEYTGYRDLGVMSIASRVYFGRYREGIMESPFTGNLADICPTGVYTDKPSRYMGRRWDYERTPGICLGCSLGCHTVVSVRYRQVVRQEAGYAERINGHFICDRGRHGYVYADCAERPRQARVDRTPESLASAVQAAAARLADQVRRHGPECVAMWSSARAALETMVALHGLSGARGWPAPVFFDDAAQAAAVRRSAEQPACALADVEDRDFILVLGVDPLNEAPMLALAMRQAVRKGAAVACLDPRPVRLPFEFDHLALRTADIEVGIGFLEQSKGRTPSPWKELKERLQSARRPLVVAGTEWLGPAAMAQAGRLAARPGGDAAAAWFPVLPGPNALAAALLSDAGRSAETLLAQIEAGQVTALLLVENDPFGHYPDQERLAAALKRLELIVALDYLHSPTLDRAHIVLPTTTVYESGGIYINQGGFAQWAAPAHHAGLPIALAGGGSHPPRQYDQGIPESDPLPAWHLLGALLPDQPGFPPERAALINRLGARHSFFKPLLEHDKLPGDGLVLGPLTPAAGDDSGGARATEEREAALFELLAAPVLFGGEELADRSPQLHPLEEDPRLSVNPDAAARLSIVDGETVAIDTGRGTIRIQAAVRTGVAPGTLILPRHRLLNWRRMSGRRQFIDGRSIGKG